MPLSETPRADPARRAPARVGHERSHPAKRIDVAVASRRIDRLARHGPAGTDHLIALSPLHAMPEL
jgi:hypothetical protein